MQMRKQDQMKLKIIIVSGYFNPLHKGHIEYFHLAKNKGDKLFVIVNNDKQRILKGSNEFMLETERVLILNELNITDKVILSVDTDQTVCNSLEKIHSKFSQQYDLYFANGGDQNNDGIPEIQLCKKLGIELIDGLGQKIQSSSWLLKKKMKIKNICCIGAGYVGGPTMAVIALKCPHINVTVVDANQEKIKAWNGPLDKLPVYEPGLAEVVEKVRNKNLYFSDNIKRSIDNAEMIFMAVNTPTKTEGEGAGMASDLSYIESCAEDIAKYSKSNKIVIEKSTLPVRTAEKIKEILKCKNKEIDFEILSNPEFLAEGTAMRDLEIPDRVLIGGGQNKSGLEAINALVKIYSSWVPTKNILTTNLWSSELSKLVANAFLAQRISSINSISELCEKTGANITEVSKAIGMDSRIGSKFLNASVGFGGSCFQKDILNLVYISKSLGLDEVSEFWNQVIIMNNHQRDRFSKNILKKLYNTIADKEITILGWSFKKDTNDSRESAAIYISKNLLQEKAKIRVYDPKVKRTQIVNDLLTANISKNLIEKNVEIFDNVNLACEGSHAVAIITEWDQFKDLNWDSIYEKMKKPAFVFDGRNILDKTKLENIGFKYNGIGV